MIPLLVYPCERHLEEVASQIFASSNIKALISEVFGQDVCHVAGVDGMACVTAWKPLLVAFEVEIRDQSQGLRFSRVGMFPLIPTVLNRDCRTPHYNPSYGLLV